mmetsp:Transcript_3299/g.4256  ORF Transcript_3299/g.4256 Transcript_3299/m.4256 type:complete len:107 (-) Transcript_3299:69-389(-)
MKAMFDLNIIWKSKYFEYFTIEHGLYIQVIEDWLSQRMQGMNSYERTLFWLFKKNNTDMAFSSARSGVGKPKSRSYDPKHAYKADERWELANLYYDSVQDSKGYEQ